MPAEWTVSGGCTTGSTALLEGGTRLAFGGAATTSTASDQRRSAPSDAFGRKEITTHDFRTNFTAGLLRHFSIALCRKRRDDDRLVWLHVSNGRDDDARRLDHVDGMDADAR